MYEGVRWFDLVRWGDFIDTFKNSLLRVMKATAVMLLTFSRSVQYLPYLRLRLTVMIIQK